MPAKERKMFSEYAAVKSNVDERVRLLPLSHDDIRHELVHYTHSLAPEIPIGELICDQKTTHAREFILENMLNTGKLILPEFSP